MVECFCVMLKLATKTAHPVNVELSVGHVEGPWVEALAECLTLDEAVKDAVHWDFSLEFLIARSHAIDNLVSQGSSFVAGSNGLLNGTVVLEGTAGRTGAKVGAHVVPEEEGCLVRALVALEGHLDAFDELRLLYYVPAIFLSSSR